MKLSRNDLETVSALPHGVLLSPCPNFHTCPGCRLSPADGHGGVSKRIEYESVSCVLPVTSPGLTPPRRAGNVFGGNRRFSHPGLGKVASRHRAIRGLSPRPSSLQSSSASCAGIALGRRRGECRRGDLPIAMPASRRARLLAAWPHRADSVHPTSSARPVVTSAAIRLAVAVCGVRGS
jgi:hypothetical protein